MSIGCTYIISVPQTSEEALSITLTLFALIPKGKGKVVPVLN
jgi:hypothetical protein